MSFAPAQPASQRSSPLCKIAPTWQSPRLDQLPSVAGWIAEAGVDRPVALDRLLRELDASAAHGLIGLSAIVSDHHQRRHRALGNQFTQRLGCRVIDRRRLRLEQAELE